MTASKLYNEGKKDKAAQVMAKIEAGISQELLPLNDGMFGAAPESAEVYYALGQKEKAQKIIMDCADNYLQQMRWFLSMSNRSLRFSRDSFQTAVSIMYHNVLPVLRECGTEDQFNSVAAQWSAMCDEFDKRVNG